jgi:hypothetical protein
MLFRSLGIAHGQTLFVSMGAAVLLMAAIWAARRYGVLERVRLAWQNRAGKRG